MACKVLDAWLGWPVTAGGGGAGEFDGGGAGGLVHYDQYPVTPGTTYTVTVGAGGVGCYQVVSGAGYDVHATAGGSSSFGPVVAVGGGAGSAFGILNPAADGGSGAGESFRSVAYGWGRGTPGQGNDGGRASLGPSLCGAGGGGAGGAGGDGVGVDPGNGGAGVYYSITGTSVCYAGGGGGGNCGGVQSKGGCPGGGDGSGRWPAPATPAAPNTGGGGGVESISVLLPYVVFGTYNPGTAHNNGGSGIVVLRF
jgi:hypothetical protein